jgi:SAM-dependent methyltransferase
VSSSDVTSRVRAVFDGAFGSAYAFWMERPWLARAIGIVMWGGDPKASYDSMRAITKLHDGAVIVDAPCGSGAAFTALSTSQQVRYIALDLSPKMLARARQRAEALNLGQIEFIEGDAARIPVETGTVDLFLSYWGLHCMPDPRAAIEEAARCLRPGGRIIGGMICQGPGLRQRLFVRDGVGGFGPGGTAEDLKGWIAAVGLKQTRHEMSGPFTVFEASN